MEPCWIIVKTGITNKHGYPILRILDYDDYVGAYQKSMHPYMLSHVKQFVASGGVTVEDTIPYFGE